MGDSFKPALHGRDHCPGGTDPLPCARIPWARVSRPFADAVQVIGSGSFTVVDTTVTYNMDPGESGTDWFQVSSDGIELVRDAHVTITGEAYWSSALTNRFFIGVADGSSAWLHGNYYMGGVATDAFGLISFTHRYSANTELELVVAQFDGANRNLDAAYLEVAVLFGWWEGVDFSAMDPNQ